MSRPLLVILAVLGLAATACGGGGNSSASDTTTTSSTEVTTTTSTLPSTTASTAPTAPPIPRCHTGDVAASFIEGSPGAGQRYATLVLTNNGAPQCTMFGYPGMQLLGSGGVELPTNVVRNTGMPKVNVSIPLHGQASTLLHWSVIPGPGEPDDMQCEPTPQQIEITVPNETTFLTIAWPFDEVCEHGTIDVNPLRLGVPSI